MGDKFRCSEICRVVFGESGKLVFKGRLGAMSRSIGKWFLTEDKLLEQGWKIS